MPSSGPRTQLVNHVRGVTKAFGARLPACSTPSFARRAMDTPGCELEDLNRLVEREGLEGALGELRRQGVYGTIEEFKGGARSCAG
jgi:hypothetical protein